MEDAKKKNVAIFLLYNFFNLFSGTAFSIFALMSGNSTCAEVLLYSSPFMNGALKDPYYNIENHGGKESALLHYLTRIVDREPSEVEVAINLD